MSRRATNLLTHYTISTDDCWIWKGGKDGDGYGVMSCNRKAHRVYFETFIGPIPDGMCVCHACDVPACVNPAHLFLGTNLQNNEDKVRKRRHIFGTRVPKAKLTERDVERILASDKPCRVLAQEHGVSDASISYIKLGKTWKHVARPPGYSYTPYRAPGDHTRFEDLQ